MEKLNLLTIPEGTMGRCNSLDLEDFIDEITDKSTPLQIGETVSFGNFVQINLISREETDAAIALKIKLMFQAMSAEVVMEFEKEKDEDMEVINEALYGFYFQGDDFEKSQNPLDTGYFDEFLVDLGLRDDPYEDEDEEDM
ncbi:hypothetical protein NIG5292_02367 [Nereida ignava]|uniref:Uncharacterized protein n=1 Tax=Nereida ignava TaxID=282199 RepID=A0A0U1NNK0_9RHOB|nr:hypothetical protein [Nereida ignava]CRK76310.1 hypothetical protein NIG5292_02367 [Nereida ignava]SFJ81256.1 hypothetical protein SAMN02745667_02443 [Nereida ignava DSM 16309]